MEPEPEPGTPWLDCVRKNRLNQYVGWTIWELLYYENIKSIIVIELSLVHAVQTLYILNE